MLLLSPEIQLRECFCLFVSLSNRSFFVTFKCAFKDQTSVSADVKARSFKIKGPMADPLIKKNVLYVYIQNKASGNIIFKNVDESQLSPSIFCLHYLTGLHLVSCSLTA